MELLPSSHKCMMWLSTKLYQRLSHTGVSQQLQKQLITLPQLWHLSSGTVDSVGVPRFSFLIIVKHYQFRCTGILVYWYECGLADIWLISPLSLSHYIYYMRPSFELHRIQIPESLQAFLLSANEIEEILSSAGEFKIECSHGRSGFNKAEVNIADPSSFENPLMNIKNE